MELAEFVQKYGTGNYSSDGLSVDERAVQREIRDSVWGERPISDGAARVIATWYNSPALSWEAAHFVNYGGVSDDPEDIYSDLMHGASPDRYTYGFDRRCRDALRVYLGAHANRPAVTGWNRIWI